MSLISDSRCLPASSTSSTYASCRSFSSPNICSCSTSEKPMIAFSGVRSSCDMLARNSDLCRLAVSSSRYSRSSSSLIRFTFARALRSRRGSGRRVAAEVARADLVQPLLGAAQGPTTDQERSEPSASASRRLPAADADEEIARTGERAVIGGHERICASPGLPCARPRSAFNGCRDVFACARTARPSRPESLRPACDWFPESRRTAVSVRELLQRCGIDVRLRSKGPAR